MISVGIGDVEWLKEAGAHVAFESTEWVNLDVLRTDFEKSADGWALATLSRLRPHGILFSQPSSVGSASDHDRWNLTNILLKEFYLNTRHLEKLAESSQ